MRKLASLLGPPLAAAFLLSQLHAAEPAARTLAFRIDEGRNINSFLRAGPVAAHLLLRSGREPRILVAFPAGNSGVGLWFARTPSPVTWTLTTPPKALNARDAEGRALHGIEFEVSVDAKELETRGAVLSSIRVLRDYELGAQAPAEVATRPRVETAGVTWQRHRLDGAAGYRLSIQSSDAKLSGERFTPAPGQPLRLRIQALTGETPLVPLDSPFTVQAAKDPRARDALSFLSYQDKFLAGSWRFDTYFGRDTLISALLLAPVLEPASVASAIASVLDRLALNGEVAHEEDIGEFAVLRNAREGNGRVATPIYDYGMVDDDFLLAPLAARWLLDDPRGRAKARAFLAARGAKGEAHGLALARNLVWVAERAAPFAESPRALNLVGIRQGRATGNWRDSEHGLGRGRYPYDVNAALVPAALEAAARLAESGLLDAHLNDERARTLKQARLRARVWATQAPALFDVEIPQQRARQDIAAYAREVGLKDGAPPVDDSARFHALSLDDQGKPVPILNSDEGFRYLLMDPPAEEIRRTLRAVMAPFPAGLLSNAGLLVANPVHASAELRPEFTRFAYHGTVVWSWQQALMLAGIDRQLRRADLPDAARTQLREAREKLTAVIEATRELRTSELWSWSMDRGQLKPEPFGRPGADADESNAAQLWSTVFLGLTIDTSPGN